jgi:hypothetical protein
MKIITNKAQILIDLPIVLITIILCFVLFFQIYEIKQYSNFLELLTITENAITKKNIKIGFLDYDEKNILQSNIVKDIRLEDPIKRITIYDYNSKIYENGIYCEKETNISRGIIYEDKISKIVFTFCK